MDQKELILLGATGSIGMQTLEVIKDSDYVVKAITAGRNINKVIEIIEQYQIEYISVSLEKDALYLKELYPDLMIRFGEEGIIEAIRKYDGDVVNAITGIAGLIPTVKAIERGKNVILANKETLVVAGEIILDLAQKYNVTITPIDSEHNAIKQLLTGIDKNEINKVIITASGGAFRDLNREQLKNVTVEKALAHPNWSMGAKITIDSATMVNKGLEVMEAHYLFGLDYDQIATVIHPESMIHSMVEYCDHSVRAVLYNPSMLIPIQNAILKRFHKTSVPSIDFENLSKLTFIKMDQERYPMIKLAYWVGKQGGLLPTVYNASNEKAVELFLDGKITFLQIEEIINNAVKSFVACNDNITIEDIINTDKMIKAGIKY